MKAGIVIDKWKLAIFTKHLRAAGYSYDTADGLTANTHTLTVKCSDPKKLQVVVEAAQKECLEQKGDKAIAPMMHKGGKYNWKGQAERLVYLGHNWSGNGYWHQFEKVDAPGTVWCEVLTADLQHFEETTP